MPARAAGLLPLTPSPVTAPVGELPAGVPALGGGPGPALFPDTVAAGLTGEFSLLRSGRWLLGRATVPIDGGLAESARRLYGELLLGLERDHLCRTWNYVPRINAAGPDGLENYRAFSAGRAIVFEQCFGRGFKRRLPASSAVGTTDDQLTVMFAAAAASPRHFENPAQVPAYDYPPEHGPRPPSFARATVVPAGDRADVFIAGTAAIKGHETVAPGDTGAQVAVMLDNLRLIGRATGLGDDLGAGRCAARHWRIYLRHAADHPAVAAVLSQALVRPGDTAEYVRADICRAALNVEIEATLFGAVIAA